MKLALVNLALAIFLFATGCAGVYVKTSAPTLSQEIKQGGGWYWYDGAPTLQGSVDKWNANK